MLFVSGGKKPSINPPISNEPSKPPPTGSSSGPKVQNLNNIKQEIEITTAHTPYPNMGVILQSLNYIQMDVFSSLFPENGSKKEEIVEEKPQNLFRREPALLSETLYNIENNFRSLF